MKKRLFIRSFLIIFFVLANITNLVTLPFTNAKYLKEEKFAYETSMYTFNPTFTVTNFPATEEDGLLYANYKMTFSRNKIIYPGEHDVYTFYARINDQKNTCIVESTPKIDNDTGTSTVTGNDNVSTIVINFKCNITELTGNIPIYFKLTEKVGTDDSIEIGSVVKTYYNNDLYNYIKHIITEGDKFDSWDSLRYAMLDYFNDAFDSNADFQNGVQLKGLTYDISELNPSFDGNFPGYALTQSAFYPLSYINTFYFTNSINSETNEIEDIEENFVYYLKTYYGYGDRYIDDIKNYITLRTGISDIGLALTKIINGTATFVPGIVEENHSSGAYGISFYQNIVPYIVNIKYGWDNYFRVESYNGANYTANYNNFVSFYGYSGLVNNSTLRNSFSNIGSVSNKDTLSRLYLLDSSDSTTNKLLVNIYRDDETLTYGSNSVTTTFHYMSATNLGSTYTIKIKDKDNFELYDLNGENPTVAITDIDDIITAIGDYAYGSGNYTYLSSVDEDGYMNVTYTLNS